MFTSAIRSFAAVSATAALAIAAGFATAPKANASDYCYSTSRGAACATYGRYSDSVGVAGNGYSFGFEVSCFTDGFKVRSYHGASYSVVQRAANDYCMARVYG